ncbi:MBL fold metallo-hydrolase [Haloactinomyces albus]|uniref:Hydroxyacylglutathione hydrolase n=1 Tax=Haloactinomyces albus TaxID=1352928 RepID=A0AAE4CRM3_9ACTN|nr:MBL fold metallo-hydrolase [Haloactinomyces albus]MDR7303853.1 hydroxyacylglutathione hydrolase [Haloactinomyces albus]
MRARIDHTTTSGTFSLDGETHAVENNVWVLGNDRECVVIDAPHDVAAIRRLIGGRRVRAILATHAHDDHVQVAPKLAEVVGAPVFLHSDDLPLWHLTHPSHRPDHELTDRQMLTVGRVDLQVLHTPGHTPGAVCLYCPDRGVVFTGDTLFAGGPGATGRSYSDFGVITQSIRDRLLALPERTAVHPGHGPSATIGEVKPHLDEWIARGF